MERNLRKNRGTYNRITLLYTWNIVCKSAMHVCMSAKSLPSRLTLFNSVDCSPPGSSVHGILQEIMLEWVSMPSSRDLPDPGIEPASLMSLALAGRFLTTSSTWKEYISCGFPRESQVSTDVHTCLLCWGRGGFLQKVINTCNIQSYFTLKNKNVAMPLRLYKYLRMSVLSCQNLSAYDYYYVKI